MSGGPRTVGAAAAFFSAIAAVAVLAACSPSKPAGPEPVASSSGAWFRDVTDSVGLNFVHDPGTRVTRDFFMPAMVGSGAALFDFDNDGRLDILLLQNGGPESKSRHQLFHQGADGRFSNVSQGSGLDLAGYGMGVAVGDVNNDGWPDVVITEFGGVHLFINKQHGVFQDISTEAGLQNSQWGTSAAFVDYDRDGWLDLVLVNYVQYEPDKACLTPGSRQDFCGPSSFEPTVTRLFHNLGRPTNAPAGSVAFQDMTSSAGLSAAKGPGLGVVCADFNADGWPDILIANDGRPNHLWINQRDGRFKEDAVMSGIAYNAMGQSQANMGVAVGDLDGDGLFDVYVTHLPGEQNICWKQGPAGVFQDRTTQMRLANPRWAGTGFGTILGDFDLDGDLDIAVVNGAVKLPLTPPAGGDPFWGRYYERNQLFANDGKGSFTDVSEADPFSSVPAVSRGLACGDIFGDGKLSLLVTRVGMSARLFRNVAAGHGHWLVVRAVDPALGGRDAYGAEVTVEAGGRRWKSWVNPGSSYLCSNDPRAHFGLGSAGKIDSMRVAWPDGKSERFPGRDADRLVVIQKGSGTPGL